jgi:molecular chaperone DnaK (HSP70)
MIKDAEKFADDDKKLKERVEARNELESYAYSLKNQLADKEKLGAKVRYGGCLLSFKIDIQMRPG